MISFLLKKCSDEYYFELVRFCVEIKFVIIAALTFAIFDFDTALRNCTYGHFVGSTISLLMSSYHDGLKILMLYFIAPRCVSYSWPYILNFFTNFFGL